VRLANKGKQKSFISGTKDRPAPFGHGQSSEQLHADLQVKVVRCSFAPYHTSVET